MQQLVSISIFFHKKKKRSWPTFEMKLHMIEARGTHSIIFRIREVRGERYEESTLHARRCWFDGRRRVWRRKREEKGEKRRRRRRNVPSRNLTAEWIIYEASRAKLLEITSSIVSASVSLLFSLCDCDKSVATMWEQRR